MSLGTPVLLLGSPMQLLIIGLIILVLFGASRLGDVGKGLGEGIKNFKKGIADDDDDEKAKAKQLKVNPTVVDTEGTQAKSESSDKQA
jgi:sec-independent protein translocase protein TatA